MSRCLVALTAALLVVGCEDAGNWVYRAFSAFAATCERDTIKWYRSADGSTFTVTCEAKKK